MALNEVEAWRDSVLEGKEKKALVKETVVL